jgi:hypothetical protein
MSVKEWVQREWTHPNVDLYAEKGDFSSMAAFMPSPNKRELQRAPSWTGFLQYPADFGRVLGGFYNQALDAFVLVGQLTSNNHLASANIIYPTFSGPHTLIASALSLGGAHKQNLLWWGDKLYVIASDGNVYYGSSYTSTLASTYAGGDAHILLPVADRLFMISTAGVVTRFTNPGFQTFYTFYPATPLDVIHVLAYHGYLMVFARGNDGSHFVHRLGDYKPTALHQITAMPYTTGEYTTYDSMFALHNDKVYFSPGLYTAVDQVTKTIDIYSFNGASVDHVSRIGPITSMPTAMGLVEWRNQLLFYALVDGEQQFKILINDRDFTDFAPNTAILLTGGDAYSAGGELGMTIESGGNDGITYLVGSGGSTLTTSYLDLGHPGILKNVIHITAILDDSMASFNVKLEYRTDDTAGWTTAINTSQTKHVQSAAINVEFYRIQIKITYDDQTVAGGQDVRLQSLSMVYNIGI